MTTPDEYRATIDRYLKWAREAQTDEERRLYLKMAGTFLRTLVQHDRSLPKLPRTYTLTDCLHNAERSAATDR
jgi:hypothetical protein